MFLGIIVISITCIIDDIKTIKPLVKLSGQLVAAIVVVSFGIRIDDITLPFINTIQMKEIFSVILTIFMDCWGNKCHKSNRWIRWVIIRNISNISYFIINNILY